MLRKVAPGRGTPWLIAGGVLAVLAALLHVAVIIGGPDWYRFFGAGEDMAQAAEQGEWMPVIVTLFIVAVLGIWALYAFSGAGRVWRLPLLRTGLVVISTIFLARGLLLFPMLVLRPEGGNAFGIWSSLIVLAYGIAYAVGTRRSWAAMSERGGMAS